MTITNKIYYVSLLISLAIHILIFIFWGQIRRLDLNFFNFSKVAKEQAERPLEFELVNPTPPEKAKTFVETPEYAQVDQAPETADYISDKNTRAQDLDTAPDKPMGEPYHEGETKYKVFSGGAAEVQAGQPVEPETERPHSSKKEQSEMAQSDTPVEMDGLISTGRQPIRSKFDRSILAGTSTGRPSTNAFHGSDDLSYDNRNFSVHDLGGISLNTYAWEWGPYLLYLKRRINDHIYPPPAFIRMGMINGETQLQFKILPDGSVQDLKVLAYKGHTSLMNTSIAAIKSSTPYKPLPEDFPEKYLELTVTFIYTNIQ